ncbi:sulfhydryl oxidase 1 [Melanotaenia boesemani]|uniref:sulfhydryl oxidase 1 n=1 Tax=Melanotaenia boesemani TaxID=1250792 RepID=UPI001C04F304|nr:sulfhydryl oxidase 1 [Melanotaenia boesemani]
MARRCGCATSRLTEAQQKYHRKKAATGVLLCFYLLFLSSAEAELYTASDQLVILTPESVKSVLVNSTAAMVVEFYASWCGHCISFSPIYKRLASDIKEWKPAVNLAAVDCASEENRKVCTDYAIRGYPTIKFFHAYSKPDSQGEDFKAFPRDVRGLRHIIIDKLEAHDEPWPPACPPLEPTSQAEIDVFFETNTVQHLALIFEDDESYIGREVTLDLLQFENIAVRRILSTENGLVTKLGVREFPSCYLYYPGGNFTRLRVNIEARTFYSYALQRLPGVVRSGKPPPVSTGILTNRTEEPWRSFNSSRVYMADLESTLHYSLRVELSSHTVIQGDALNSLKKYISVLAKYFPGRPVVKNLLKYLNSWLQRQTSDHISYEAFQEILDNTAQLDDTALPEGVRWVGCQGSQPHFRRYPCGVWTLFHVLTVQAKNTGSSDCLEVLSSMRNYIHNFFGCRHCAEHFENMAREGLQGVDSVSAAVLWLWSRHNIVNNRIAGALSEDPLFPKIQWPPPEMCSACHTVKEYGEHKWNKEQVLSFLLSHFNSSSILTDYLEDESQILEKQRERHARRLEELEAMKPEGRKVRDVSNFIVVTPSSLSPVQEEEEEEEEPQDEAAAYDEEEGGEGAPAAAIEMEGKSSEPTTWTKPEMEVGHNRRQVHKKPSIVGMRMREQKEDIVDLDSFVNQHFKAKALQLAASSRVKQRTLQRQREVEQEPRHVYRLGMELDAGFGMVGLQPLDADLDLDMGQQKKRLLKRDLTGQNFERDVELNHKARWMSMLNIGFSKLDISLCVILYFLSSMCLLGMYLFFKNRLRRRRVKIALP